MRLYITLLVLFLLSVMFPLLVFLKMRRLRKFRQKGVVTIANIINAEKKIGSKGAVYYILLIQYRDQKGVLYRGNIIGYGKTVDGTMPIVYEAANPHNFKTEFGNGLRRVFIVSIVLCAVITCLCLWILWATADMQVR